MAELISPIKKRVIAYLKYKKVRKETFYASTGIHASNFKSNGLKSELGGEKIAKIVSTYPDLNPDWLLNGNGKMIRKIKTDEIIPSEYEIRRKILDELITFLLPDCRV